MPITFPEVAVRVRQNVLDPIIAASCRPSMPIHQLRVTPCLAFTQNGFNGLAGRLQNEFSAEHLQLTPNELSKLGPSTVEQLASGVYQRVRAYSPQVKGRVITSIKSMLPNPATSVTVATVVIGGGLNLSKSAVAKTLVQSFFPLIRLRLKSSDLYSGITVGAIVNLIVPQFNAQGR